MVARRKRDNLTKRGKGYTRQFNPGDGELLCVLKNIRKKDK